MQTETKPFAEELTMVEGKSFIHSSMGISDDRADELKEAIRKLANDGNDSDSFTITDVLQKIPTVVNNMNELVFVCFAFGMTCAAIDAKND